MTTSYKELLQQREALEQAIAAARQREISDAVAKVRELVAEFLGKPDDLIDTHEWSAASAEVARWLDDEGPWIIEGVAMSRALRKWRRSSLCVPTRSCRCVPAGRRSSCTARSSTPSRRTTMTTSADRKSVV